MNTEHLLAEAYNYSIPLYKGIREYHFNSTSGNLYSVQFVQVKNNTSHFIVDLCLRDLEEDEYKTTNSDNIYRKMATLIAILLHFIQNNELCEAIEFTPVEEENKAVNRRLIVFRRYSQLFCKISGWHFQIIQGTFILSKKANNFRNT
ncbi:MAG TPA: hypothetical protein PLI97_03005 [Fluviicola sp.]|nr:hypothetical protein [Fluviicola sp.]